MYCRQCGERINENQAVCLKCGVYVGKGDTYCANCGKEVIAKADVCISCGYKIKDIRDVYSGETPQPRQKSKRKFAIGFTFIAVLTTILLLIPHYLFIYGHYSKGTIYYSFIEWMEGMSIIVLLLLWVNPIISFGDVIGTVIVISNNSDISEFDVTIAGMIAQFLGKYVED